MDGEAKRDADIRPGEPAAKDKPSFWGSAPVIIVGTMLLAVLFFLGLRYFADSLTHETTDDAFLDAHIVTVAPRVAGQVKALHVNDNDHVIPGQLLFELDPRDFQVQLDQKQAAVKAAQANLDLVKATVELFRSQIGAAEATAKQTAAETTAAQATAERARSDLKRAEDLFRQHTISPQEYDTAKATAAAAEANLRAAEEKAASDQAKVAQAEAQLEAGKKGYERAVAQANEAEMDSRTAALDLSYTRITAVQEGRIARKSVEPGNYVQIGQSLCALVPTNLFVTANFKETQLIKIRTNQPVRVQVDSVAGRSFAGHVDSIQPGSGARFSLLPPENAVGNYVKVVQRVPVKIVFDEPLVADHVLGPGMSVTPSVRVKEHEIPGVVVILVALVLSLAAGAIWWRATAQSRERHPDARR